MHELAVAGVLRYGDADAPLDPWPQILAAARNAVQAISGDLETWRDREVMRAVASASRLLIREGRMLG